MAFSVNIGLWDVILVLAVSVQCTIIAYVREPAWKAVALGLPIPFTFASLALGEPINVTHVTGLLVFLAYAHAVRFLYARFGVPIVGAIGLAAFAYCLAAFALAAILPRSEAAFWLACALVFITCLLLHLRMPQRKERAHRTSLPFWLKAPVIAAIILAIVALKEILHGFMTVFPMVGIVAAYEARYSLWTVCRHISAILMAFVAMMATMYLVQDSVGLGGGLLAGWVVFLVVRFPFVRRMRPEDAKAESVTGG